jgi:hypothetical protein
MGMDGPSKIEVTAITIDNCNADFVRLIFLLMSEFCEKNKKNPAKMLGAGKNNEVAES